jgi:hypothetical protein
VSDDPVIQDVVDTAAKVAMRRFKGLFDLLNDDEADKVLAMLLTRHWKRADAGDTGNSRLVQWVSLGRAVEDVSRHISVGFGQGWKVESKDRREISRAITLIYKIAAKAMAELDTELPDE